MAVSFCLAFIIGFLMLLSPRGTWEMNWASALIFWFDAFLHILRFRYRTYDHGVWIEEIIEQVSLVAFAIPGFILGWLTLDPWIMCAVCILGMSIWFVLWRLFLEDLIHGFWW